MAAFNLTVEDSSPLIIYSPAGSWVDTPAGDTFAAYYSGGSLHITATQGATATIDFNGTGISIFGGHRPNYGTFSLVVDGQLVTAGSAQSTIPSTVVTRQVLGSVSGLINGPHTAVFANTNGEPVDIDSLELQSQVGGPGSAVTPQTFDDSDIAITYLPSPSAWQTTRAPVFFNDTLHYSETPGTSASLSFSGEAVALYGTVSPSHANINITIDGQSLILPGGAGGQVSALRPQVLLYYQNSLLPGQHILVLSGDSTPPAGPSIDLDSIITFDAIGTGVSTEVSSRVMPTPAPTHVPTGSTSSFLSGSTATENLLQPTSNKSLSTRTIVGAVVGGVVGFMLLVAFLALGFLLYRRRRRREARLVEDSMVPISPALPMQRDSEALEADSVRFEDMVFPLPPPTEAMSFMRSHSRDGSVTSTTALMPSVPVLNIPQPRPFPTPVNIRSDDSIPSRPSTRPPTMNFDGLDPEQIPSN